MKKRISRKFFCLLLTVVMICTLLPITTLAAEPSGTISSGSVDEEGLHIELVNTYVTESVDVEIYSGTEQLTTASLNISEESPLSLPHAGDLSCFIKFGTPDPYWPYTSWTPRADLVPNKAVLFIDGEKVGEKDFTLDSEAWANLSAVKPAPSGSIMRAYLNTDRITVDMANVTFYESVALELYSGGIKLTTSTLNTNLVPAGKSYGELTGMIGLTANDENWTYTAWTPKKDVVPDEVRLLVDGVLKDTAQLVVVFNGEETKLMTADDWKALDATIYTASGSIERAGITHANEEKGLKNAVSVDLKKVAFNKSVVVKLYSGKKLLTTATLNTEKLPAGSYEFLTCCIATQTADESWSLTRWTPKDNVVPNKVVLFVDGIEKDTKEFTLDAAEWKALPGTVRPSSNTNTNTNSGTTITQSPKTADAGIAVYGVMSVMSLLGMGYVSKRKSR